MPNLHNTSAFGKTIRHHNGVRGEFDCVPQKIATPPSGGGSNNTINSRKKT